MNWLTSISVEIIKNLWFSDDFRVNTSLLVRLNSLNVRSENWNRSLTGAFLNLLSFGTLLNRCFCQIEFTNFLIHIELFDLYYVLSSIWISLCKKCPYSELFWSAFSRIRTEYGEILRIQSECGKIRTRITPNTDTFHAVYTIKVIFTSSSLFLRFPG